MVVAKGVSSTKASSPSKVRSATKDTKASKMPKGETESKTPKSATREKQSKGLVGMEPIPAPIGAATSAHTSSTIVLKGGKAKAPKSAKWEKKTKGPVELKASKSAEWGKKSKKSVGMEPTPAPIDTIQLTAPPLEITLDIADGSGEINEGALQTISEEYALVALKSALPSANVKSVTVTITKATSRRRWASLRLATTKYIISITVLYEQTSEGEDAASFEEAIKEQIIIAFEGDAFIAALQEDESIGATVTGAIVAPAPTPAPTTPPTFMIILTPTPSPTSDDHSDDHTHTPTADDHSDDHTHTPTADDHSDDHTHTPTVDDHSDDHTPTPTVDDHSDDHTHTPTADDHSDDHTHTPTTDDHSDDNTHTPTVDDHSDDHTHTPTVDDHSDDHTHTPTVDDHSDDQTHTPTVDDHSDDHTHTPTADDHSDDHTHTPTLDTHLHGLGGHTHTPVVVPTDKPTAAPTPYTHVHGPGGHNHNRLVLTEEQTPLPTIAALTLPPTNNCISDIPCTDIPVGLVSCGILNTEQPVQCEAGSHCYGFPTAPAQDICVPESSNNAYDACNSNCDCLGINTFGNDYKYFVTDEYGNVSMQFSERCTDCYNSVGGQECVPSSYANMGTHEVKGQDNGGCFSDPTPDNNDGGFFYAYNFLKDTQDCIPKLQRKQDYACYWNCKKN